MMSQKESSSFTQYTPLYENEQFESKISQWRLLEPFEQDINNAQECSIKDQVLEEDIDWALNDLNQDDPELVRIIREKYLIKPSKKAINLTKPATAKFLQGQF